MNIAGNFPDDEAGEEVATSPGCEAGIDPDCGTESRDVNKEEMVAGAGFEGEKTILPAIFVTDFLFTSYLSLPKIPSALSVQHLQRSENPLPNSAEGSI